MKFIGALAVPVGFPIHVMAQLPKVSHIGPDAGSGSQSVVAHAFGSSFEGPPIFSVVLEQSARHDADGTLLYVMSWARLRLAPTANPVFGKAVFDLTPADGGRHPGDQ